MTKESNTSDIDNLEGLGDPLFFAFTIDPKTKIMTGHAVIFASFVWPGEKTMKLAELSDDPRFRHFLHYMVSNGKEMLNKMAAEREELERSIADLKSKDKHENG